MRNLTWLREKEYPLLIEPTQILLKQTGKPWVIENVMGSKLDANWLCGEMFGKPFYRHRYFQSSFLWLAPPHPPHTESIRNGRTMGSRARDIVHTGAKKWHGTRSRSADIVHPSQWPDGAISAPVDLVREIMEVTWMTGKEVAQAIPPCYTKYVGEQWMRGR